MPRNPTLAPASGPLHVAIVSTDPLVRAGLASIIEPELGSARIVDDLDQADVALWDTGTNLDQVLGHLARIDSVDMPVLAVVPSASFAGPALDAGAGGVVLRDRLGEGLVAALAAVRHGFVVLDAALAAGLTDTTSGHRAGADQALESDIDRPGPADAGHEDVLDAGPARAPRPDDEPGLDALTARERQVIELLVQGLSNRRIADVLAISEHTAKFHVNSIMSKLGASTRTEAVVEALRRGLVLL
jgi:two-component system, NarL family, nitrate/nitrite response regulator NarL